MRTLLAASLMLLAGCSRKEEPPAGTIGVSDCDTYIAKYQTCLANMPAPARSTAEQGFKAQQEAWKATAATEEGKRALVVGCKATLASLASNAQCK
ncbi:MAG: hypothetical protein JWP97_846 [Labilithrix sp.]|nr:hypothetical protein [Labilithrix sp.]